jgi:hypothetical protein
MAEQKKTETDRAEARVQAERDAIEQAHRDKKEKAQREKEDLVRKQADDLIFGRIDAIAQEQRDQKKVQARQSQKVTNKAVAVARAATPPGAKPRAKKGAAWNAKGAAADDVDPFGDFIVLQPNPELAANVSFRLCSLPF